MITVDKEKCTSCNRCAEECPSLIIRLEEGYPVIFSEKSCILCGHCVAVCPKAALDHEFAPLAKQVSVENQPVLTPGQAEMFIRSRRSIRAFKNKTVEKEKILQLLNVARFAPSSSNTQGISYLVVDGKDKLRQISGIIEDWMGEQGKTEANRSLRIYKVFVERCRRQGIDWILREAPALIIGLAPRELEVGFSNTRFALAYAELFAPTLGLGSCWAGFFEMAGKTHYQPLRDFLQLPENLVITGGLMLGYPKYQYPRLVDRNPLQVEFL